MSKGIFVTGTGTDIGKTYVTALILKKLRELGVNVGYYKAAASGSHSFEDSDGGYVKSISDIDQEKSSMISYIYKTAVSPHLAAKIEGNPPNMDMIISDFTKLKSQYDYLVVEGSGGIICPIRYDEHSKIFLTDIIQQLELSVLVVGDANLGTINAVSLTCEYLKSKQIEINGIILNHYSNILLHNDNIKIIEEINNIPVVALVKDNATSLDIESNVLTGLFEELK